MQLQPQDNIQFLTNQFVNLPYTIKQDVSSQKNKTKQKTKKIFISSG